MTLKLRWGQLEVALSSRGRLGVRLAVWCGGHFGSLRGLSLWRGANFVLAVGWRCEERSRAEVDRVAS